MTVVAGFYNHDAMILIEDYPKVPMHVVEAFSRYKAEKIRPGSFLCAVIAGDLFEAVQRADKSSLEALVAITQMVIKELPESARGSRAAINDWTH